MYTNELAPINLASQHKIANNVIKACANIEALNKQGYNYISGMSGFIAHYSINGFKDYYSHHSLAQDIKDNQRQNQCSNFRHGDNNADYYHSKRDIYNAILKRI